MGQLEWASFGTGSPTAGPSTIPLAAHNTDARAPLAISADFKARLGLASVRSQQLEDQLAWLSPPFFDRTNGQSKPQCDAKHAGLGYSNADSDEFKVGPDDLLGM